MLTLSLLLLLVLCGLAYVLWSIYTYPTPPEAPPVLVFSWGKNRVEVASPMLVEWLALRQLHSEEWPPMRDLLAACRMMGTEMTEKELRQEVWRNLDRIRRATKRGDEALS